MLSRHPNAKGKVRKMHTVQWPGAESKHLNYRRSWFGSNEVEETTLEGQFKLHFHYQQLGLTTSEAADQFRFMLVRPTLWKLEQVKEHEGHLTGMLDESHIWSLTFSCIVRVVKLITTRHCETRSSHLHYEPATTNSKHLGGKWQPL